MDNEVDKNMLLVLQQKAQLFLEKNYIAYVRTKEKNNYNGQIMWVGADFFIIKDVAVGDVPIFYLEVSKLTLSRKEIKNDL